MTALIAIVVMIAAGLVCVCQTDKKPGAATGSKIPPCPVSSPGYQHIDAPWFKERLKRWNERNPDYIYPGPENEAADVRRARYDLLTPEQLATIPFRQRAIIRNNNCHLGEHNGTHWCVICGGANAVDWCYDCEQRYERDMADGWALRPGNDVAEKYRKTLWTFQQIVAKDLQMGIITEEIARAELKEVVAAAKQEIDERLQRDAEIKMRIQARKTQQAELSDIVKRLS